MSDAQIAWLAGLGEPALGALLARRPDVLRGRPPGTLTELAERWGAPESLLLAVRQLTRPELQALEALCALGERRTMGDLAGLLTPTTAEHPDDVVAVLAQLQRHALVWPAGGSALEVPAALPMMFPTLLGSPSLPLRPSWEAVTADEIRTALRALGSRGDGRKSVLVDALVGRLADPATVRGVLDSAPEAVQGDLQLRVDPAAAARHDPDLYDPARYRQRMTSDQWAISHGLAIGSWGQRPMLPTEVVLAIRGPEYRAPFDVVPPPVPPGPLAPEQVRSATAGAVAAFLGRAVGLLDQVARTPLPRLATGGIGVRDLAKLAKTHGSDAEVRLVLELARAADLIDTTDQGYGASPEFGTWRESLPAEQLATLLDTWWALARHPTTARDADGKAVRALLHGSPGGGYQDARAAVLQAAAQLPAGTADPRDLARAAVWTRPLVHPVPGEAFALATVVAEAELLGAVAGGALTPVGRALLAGDGAALRAVLTELLPASSDRASFGSDLTALVAGSPSARLTRLLDDCADRESSGGAVTWRFSPDSVRRAMDDGATQAQLLTELAGLTDRPLPQTLEYLIGDVARRHGLITGAEVTSVLRSDDAALLAEVAADRRLAALGLRLLAPTVLGCAVPLDKALARLRAVGYFPVAESGSAPPDVEAPAAPELHPGVVAYLRGQAARQESLPAPEPAELARLLLAAGPDAAPDPLSPLAAEIGQEARRLARHEVEQLAAAIQQGGRVLIEYQSSSGGLTRRVIAGPILSGRSVLAFCELRQAERWFTLERIHSVQPV